MKIRHFMFGALIGATALSCSNPRKEESEEVNPLEIEVFNGNLSTGYKILDTISFSSQPDIDSILTDRSGTQVKTFYDSLNSRVFISGLDSSTLTRILDWVDMYEKNRKTLSPGEIEAARYSPEFLDN